MSDISRKIGAVSIVITKNNNLSTNMHSLSEMVICIFPYFTESLDYLEHLVQYEHFENGCINALFGQQLRKAVSNNKYRFFQMFSIEIKNLICMYVISECRGWKYIHWV